MRLSVLLETIMRKTKLLLFALFWLLQYCVAATDARRKEVSPDEMAMNDVADFRIKFDWFTVKSLSLILKSANISLMHLESARS